MKKISKNLLTAINASVEAGKKILEVYQSENFQLELKDDSSPLTKADLISNETILSILKINSAIPVLSEEESKIDYKTRKYWKKLWIVDPLDGTKEFIKRNGEFTVNIALVENQEPVLGVIYVPVSNDLYFSEKRIGSFKINLSDFLCCSETLINHSQKLPISVNNENFTIVSSSSHISQETEDYMNKKKKKYDHVELTYIGSSLKFCMIAEGKAKCYPRFAPTMEWDTAAGHAICINAGFSVTDVVKNKALTYNKKNLLNNWFIVE